MFNSEKQESRRQFIKCVGAGLALASLSGCGRYEDTKNDPEEKEAALPALPALKLGIAGDAAIYLKEFDGHMLLCADGFHANSVIEHVPVDPTEGETHSCSIKEIEGNVGDGALYLIELDGARYIYIDGFKSGGFTKLTNHD